MEKKFLNHDVVFHEASFAVCSGKVFECKGKDSIKIHIKTSAENTARKLEFKQMTFDGTITVIQGVNDSTGASASSTTGTNESWTINVKNMDYVLVDLTQITGGTVQVDGNSSSIQ